jgi:large subunit ribosomal protein L18e
MISKTKIKKGKKRKTNSEIVKTINIAKKNNLMILGKKLSGPTRKYIKVNIDDLNELEGNKIMIVGKVLSSGNINKKIEISAMGFSKKAREKLEIAGCKARTIREEIEKDPKLEGVKII